MDRSCKRARAVVRVFCCFPPSCRTQVGCNSLAKLRSPLQLYNLHVLCNPLSKLDLKLVDPP